MSSEAQKPPVAVASKGSEAMKRAETTRVAKPGEKVQRQQQATHRVPVDEQTQLIPLRGVADAAAT